MNLESYVGQYTFADILAIEESDRQFIALQQSWSQVSALGMTQELFVYLVVQCALISFQVAGSGPDRWEEFGRKVVSDCATLMSLGHDNVDWRYDFLTHSRYNKRLYNIKRKRLEKFVN
ncbi:N-glycosylase/DNA lyase [Patescibacteria group bacterium]|nr:N-glycosylase/DNA lyase [Patescibacteria group bacterium]